jgi:FkbM family methyltransferase
MIRVVPLTFPDEKVPIGRDCEYQVEGMPADGQVRFTLRHHGIHYLKYLTDWVNNNTIRVFPEAPGEYQLIVEYRAQDGTHGFVERRFCVEAEKRWQWAGSPQLVRTTDKTQIWAPNEWEAKQVANYDRPVFVTLKQVLRPGWVVYDVGANLGVYSIFFARQVGKEGHVYSIEANPLCAYLARANLEQNGSSNYSILPVALLDSIGNVNFAINYDNSNLGVSRRSSFYGAKLGHEFAVQTYSLDQLIVDYSLRQPNFIKIDIEGAEGYAVAGMTETIRQTHPAMLIEAHGRKAAEETFPQLDGVGYHYQIVSSGERFASAKDLLAWFPDAVLEIVCLPD